MKQVLKDISMVYETCFNNWKLSGFHYDVPYDPLKLFDDFSQGNDVVMYFHCDIYQFPEIFSKVTGQLPKDIFFESASNEKKNPLKTKKRKVTASEKMPRIGMTTTLLARRKTNLLLLVFLLKQQKVCCPQ